jgi:hypothetical protein
MKPREARYERSARQEIAKLLLDKTRQSLAVAHAGRLGAEGLEVVTHQLVEFALFGSARSIND